MPNYKGHLAGGAVAYTLLLLAVGYQQPVATAAQWLVFCLLGSLFPDIDTKSKGQKFFYRLVAVALVVLFYQQRYVSFALVSFMALLPVLANHRGLFHRLWFIVLTLLGVYGFMFISMPGYASIALWNILFFLAGAISHLWLDFGFRRMMRL